MMESMKHLNRKRSKATLPTRSTNNLGMPMESPKTAGKNKTGKRKLTEYNIMFLSNLI